jgi:hypothetical protein
MTLEGSFAVLTKTYIRTYLKTLGFCQYFHTQFIRIKDHLHILLYLSFTSLNFILL